MATGHAIKVSAKEGSQRTPIKGRVPHGQVTVSDRWRGSELVKTLQGKVRVSLEEDLGIIDFYPSNAVGIIYIHEGEIVTGTSYRRKLVKLRKGDSVRGVVLAEKTPTSSQYFAALQKYAVLDLGLVLLPVNSQTEAASIISEIVRLENRPSLNQFRIRATLKPPDAALLTTVRTIPGLGDAKATLLLNRFKNVAGICNATEEELVGVVGRAGSTNIRQFFWGMT